MFQEIKDRMDVVFVEKYFKIEITLHVMKKLIQRRNLCVTFVVKDFTESVH